MDYLAELRHRGFSQAGDGHDPEGRVQFDCDLYAGTSSELTVQVYAADLQALQREVMPTLEAVLPLIDSMVEALGEIDADLAQIILFRGRLGLHFWSRGINNEFTAVYAHSDARWAFQGFGEIFSDD
ncbi:hypothetical protein [Variovorax sp. GB1P17]|uniref:hypothetical protein n=1 Tax=Variovorax sp. GB1P17 TaxID=3443740 RepID=UPI003F488E4F